MSAGSYNMCIRQGETFSRVITWKSAGVLVNLTGYTAKMQVRRGSGQTVVSELSTTNGRISLGGSAGTITLTIAATDTDDIAIGTYKYDLLLTSSGGVVTNLLEGEFKVVSGITQ